MSPFTLSIRGWFCISAVQPTNGDEHVFYQDEKDQNFEVAATLLVK